MTGNYYRFYGGENYVFIDDWQTKLHNYNKNSEIAHMRRKQRSQRASKKKVIQIVDQTFHMEQSTTEINDSSAVIMQQEDIPSANSRQLVEPKPRIIKIKPIVQSSSQDEQDNEKETIQRQNQSQYFVNQRKREKQPCEEQDEKKETVQTSSEIKHQGPFLGKKNIIFEDVNEKTEHYDYSPSISSEEEDSSSEQQQMTTPVKTIKQQQQKIMPKQKILKTFIADDLESLLFGPVPKNCTVSCVIAWQNTFFDSKRTYHMYLLNDKRYVASAIKNRFRVVSVFDFVRGNQDQPPLAQLKSNFTGLQYVLERQYQQQDLKIQKQLLWIGYDFNIFGLSSERNITILRNSKNKLQRIPFFSQIKNYYDNGMSTKFTKFTNKKAAKNPQTGQFQLDFHKQSIKPSGRNVILTDDGDRECLILAKKKQQIFMLDVSHPFTLLEGFAIAVANLDRKLCVR